MADLSFYQHCYGITTIEVAFDKFAGTLQNYYDANFYVDWGKVLANARRYHPELLLLSSLCHVNDKEAAARDLLSRFPQVIPALPILIGCRNTAPLQIVEDAEEARVITYDFALRQTYSATEIEHYTQFLLASGLIDLLGHIHSVPDYVTGVEVGMDTNGRKNRGGKCGIRAIRPFVEEAQSRLAGMKVKPEASFSFLRDKGCSMPREFTDVQWDWAFWSPETQRWAVMEVNHYGSSGSKPLEVARDYMARQQPLSQSGIGFIWVTDGQAWRTMHNTLRQAFGIIDHMVNVRLAADGQLEWTLRHTIFETSKALPAL